MSPRVAIYVRGAPPDHAGNSAIAQELERLRAFARERSWSVPPVQIYRDDGVSGMHLDWPALSRLRDAIARGELDALLATSPDRLARDGAASVQVLDECERAGCDIVFVRQPRSEERAAS